MAQQRARARAAADEAGAAAGDSRRVARAARRVRRRPSSPAARSTSPRRTVVALVVDGGRVDEAARGRDRRGRARPHAVLRGVGRSGRRHRHDHDVARRRPTVLDVRDTRYGIAGARRRARVRRAQRRRPRGRRGGGRDRRRAPRPHPPQPHRHAHPALGAARGARRPRAAGRFDGRRPIVCASTSAITTRSRPSSSRRSSGSPTSR